MASAETVIRLSGITTRFGSHVVHRDLELSVLRGEVLCIVGGSGSGKTTLLREMLGLDEPTEGKIEILGVTLSELEAQELAENHVPETSSFAPRKKVPSRSEGRH